MTPAEYAVGQLVQYILWLASLFMMVGIVTLGSLMISRLREQKQSVEEKEPWSR